MLLTKRHRREPIPRHAAASHLNGRRDEEISFRDIAAMPEPEWTRNEAVTHFWSGRFMPAALVPSGRVVAILLPDPAAEEVVDLTAAQLCATLGLVYAERHIAAELAPLADAVKAGA